MLPGVLVHESKRRLDKPSQNWAQDPPHTANPTVGPRVQYRPWPHKPRTYPIAETCEADLHFLQRAPPRPGTPWEGPWTVAPGGPKGVNLRGRLCRVCRPLCPCPARGLIGPAAPSVLGQMHTEVLKASFRRRQWHPTPVLLPGKSHGRRSLVGCSPWGR